MRSRVIGGRLEGRRVWSHRGRRLVATAEGQGRCFLVACQGRGRRAEEEALRAGDKALAKGRGGLGPATKKVSRKFVCFRILAHTHTSVHILMPPPLHTPRVCTQRIVVIQSLISQMKMHRGRSSETCNRWRRLERLRSSISSPAPRQRCQV